MKIGDYVLYDGFAWRVWLKHSGGTYQIKNLTPDVNHINNMQVVSNQVEVITKEVADILIVVNNHKEK
jgi:hypothetical protein